MTDNKKAEITNVNDEEHIGESLDPVYQGVKRLFVLAYSNAAGND